jgi:hypothetical protein
MPNDAKLGLFLGLVVVIALSIIYHGKGPEQAPEAAMQARGQLATSARPNAVPKPASGSAVAWPSLPVRDEVQVDKVGRKEDSAQRVNGEPDAPDQKHDENN